MLVPIRGVPTWRVETNIVTEFCYESVNSYLEELINIFKVALFYYKDSSDGKILPPSPPPPPHPPFRQKHKKSLFLTASQNPFGSENL